jgi:hypothetical protein
MSAPLALDDSFSSPDRALDREEPPFRQAPDLKVLPGGKSKARKGSGIRPEPMVRPLTWVQAHAGAWLAGLLLEEPCWEITSGDALEGLQAKGYAEGVIIEAHHTKWYLTPAGKDIVLAYWKAGALEGALPFPEETPPAPKPAEGYTVQPCALMPGEFIVCCSSCDAVLSDRLGGTFTSARKADDHAWMVAGWHPKHGCPGCQKAGGR